MVGLIAGANDSRIAFSPTEAARQVGLGRTTLYAEIGSGRLKSVKIGARRLITARALEEWLAARQAEGEADER